ncbi:MAG TPA: FemAB family XrtA/PEP-CTERM system-associated protein [Blastocatellia bacterium]|nr:FemAB family XrtA/PEP-CTERM system-associated protein [Blastocatellia bacterium]
MNTAISEKASDKPSALTVRKYSAAEWSAALWKDWDDYVHRHPLGTFCHLSGWSRVIERTWHHRPRHLYAERGGRITGVLPLFHVSSRLFGSMLVSTPNAVYGGALARDPESRRALLDEAKELARQLNVDYLELRDMQETAAENSEGNSEDSEFRRKDLYVTFEHPITTDEEALMKTFPRDLRTMIRKGIKNNLTAEVGREELLDEFYDVYATSVRNLGTPVFPKKLFAGFLREFPRDSDILLVRQGGRVAGGVLSFYFRGCVLPYYGGAYPEFYRTGVNNFMYWELMRAAAARGSTSFDFGRSKLGTGAYEFKRGWGMTARPLPYKFFLVRSRELPNLNPMNPKFELMINIWKKLPLGLTKLLGPMIVKNLP